MGPKQIVMNLPNEPGQLSTVSELLGLRGINIKAVSISVDGDQGVLSMVLDDHEKGKLVLQGSGYEPTETPIIAAYAPDHPGGLNAVMKPLKESGVNVEKLYLSVARKGEHAMIILEVDKHEEGTEALKANYVEVIEGKFKF